MTAIAAELSAKLISAPITIFSMNIESDFLVPEGVEIGLDEPRERNANAPSGRLLLQGKRVSVKQFLGMMNRAKRIPLRFSAFRRPDGKRVRMVTVCVAEETLRPGETRILPAIESEVRRLLEENLWDIRIYRNRDNFVIEAGNPRFMKRGPAELELQADAGGEFDLVPMKKLKDDSKRMRENARLAREILENAASTHKRR